MANVTQMTGFDKFLSFQKVEAMVDSTVVGILREIGDWALENAPKVHVFDNYSFNLEGSYAYAIYKNGDMIGQPVLNRNAQYANLEETDSGYTGPEMSWNYLKELNPGDGYSLVFCANTPYAQKVENINQVDVLLTVQYESYMKAETEFSNIKWRVYEAK